MAHLTLRNSYLALSNRLNRFPQGAPPSELLFQILEVLFTKDEAALVALLPIKPFNVAAAARVWKKPVAESRKILEGLASRGMLLDMEVQGEQIFVLPPPMAGFFEFSMMRLGNGYDQKLLAELFYQYLNVEEDFVKDLFAGGETQLGRAFVNERAVATDQTLAVMDYERSSEVIHMASHMGVGACYCRHKIAAHGEILRCSHEHLHDLQRNGPVADQARHCAQGRCKRRYGSAGRGFGAQSRAVRGERTAEGGVHMQLLRMLLRGYARRQTLRRPKPHRHHQLPAGSQYGFVQRLRQMRDGLSSGGHGTRVCRRPS